MASPIWTPSAPIKIAPCEFLRRVVEQTPRETRTAFWRDVVETDPAFNSIRRLSEYARMAEANRPPGRLRRQLPTEARH